MGYSFLLVAFGKDFDEIKFAWGTEYFGLFFTRLPVIHFATWIAIHAASTLYLLNKRYSWYRPSP